jgi:hypothetical protein
VKRLEEKDRISKLREKVLRLFIDNPDFEAVSTATKLSVAEVRRIVGKK